MASASLDHSAIYLRIAGTTILGADEERIGVWLGAAIGTTLKLARPGRFDRLAIVLYLLLGRSGVVVYETIASVVPSLSLWPLVIGGILLDRHSLSNLAGLPFHNAIWHGFVLPADHLAILTRLAWR